MTFLGGNTAYKYLFTPKKEPTRDQSKDHTNVQLNEPKFLLSLTGVWVTWNKDELKAAASLKSSLQHR